MLKIFYW